MIFSIEGNIGSGKSTLIGILKNELSLIGLDVIFLPEPIEIWNSIKDTSGQTILQKYYSNQEQYSFSFQMMAYISRLSQIRKALKDNVTIITERCLFTDRNVFAKMLYDSGKIEEINYLIYLRWFDEFIDELPEVKYIYLDIAPEICQERIKQRNRKGEECIPLEYLTECHKYHQEWLNPKINDILYLTDSVESIFKINEFVKSTLKLN